VKEQVVAGILSPGGHRFLTASEAAERMRVSKMTVYRLIRAGKLPAVQIGKAYRVREDELEGYLDASYVNRTGEQSIEHSREIPPRGEKGS
jgi:excisionase family DNA binding protein